MSTIRITDKDLDGLCDTLNSLKHAPMTPWADGVANVGNYHIGSSNYGVCLDRIDNTSGGTTTVLGNATKRDLYRLINAYINGIQQGVAA